MKRFTSSYGLAFGVGLVLAVVASLSIVLAQAYGGDRGPFGASDSDLPDEVRSAKYATARAQSAQTHREVVRDFIASGAPVQDLRRLPLAADYAPSRDDFAATVARSNEIFRGVVLNQHVVAKEDGSAPMVVSTVAVSQWLKGGGGEAVVELAQYGSPILLQDGSIGLSFAETDPVVQMGADIVLFSEQRDSQGRFFPLPYKTLEVDDGKIQVNPIDGKGGDHDGDPVSALLSDVQQTVAAQESTRDE